MKKKMICGILAVIVLFTHTLALCETTAAAPSPARQNTIVAQTEDASKGFSVVITLTEDSAALDEQIAVAKESKTAADYFGEEAMEKVVEALADSLAESTAAEKASDIAQELVLAELWAVEEVSISGQIQEDVELFYAFDTEYEADTLLVGMVGFINDNEITWVPIPAEPINGQVKLTFSQSILEEIFASEGVLIALLQGDMVFG